MKKAKFLTLLIASMFLFSACTVKKEASTLDKIRLKNEIVIGVKNDSKPFGFIKNRELAGYDIDVAKLVAKNILKTEDTSKIIFKPLRPDEKIYALNSKEVDMVIAVMSITSSRLAVIDFSKPYYIAGLAIMVRKNSDIHNIFDLNNQNVGIIIGTTGENTVRVLAPNAKIMGARGYLEGFELLKSGKIDALLADDSLLYGFVMDNKNYKIIPKRYSQEFYAIAIRKNDTKLQNALNNIIDEISQNGELKKIQKKWLYR